MENLIIKQYVQGRKSVKIRRFLTANAKEDIKKAIEHFTTSYYKQAGLCLDTVTEENGITTLTLEPAMMFFRSVKYTFQVIK